MNISDNKWQTTGAQFNVFSSELSDFEKLTLRFIRAFEDALHKQGYAVRIGMEEELALHADSLNGTTAPMTADDPRKRKPNPRKIQLKPEEDVYWPASDKFAADMQTAISAAFESSYISSKHAPTIERIEHSARGNQHRFEIVTAPLAPLSVAMLGRVIMRNFYLASQEGQESEAGQTLSSFARRVQKASPNYTQVRFYPASANALYSQHSNVSIHNEERGNLMTDPAIAYRTAESFKKLTKTDLLVLMTGDASETRLQKREDAHSIPSMESSLRIHDEGPEKSRVEFRIPDASSHPFLTVLMSMAACYDAVIKKDKGVNSPLPSSADSDSLKFLFRHRAQNFEQASTLLPLIKEVLEAEGQDRHEVKQAVNQFKSAVLAAYNQNHQMTV